MESLGRGRPGAGDRRRRRVSGGGDAGRVEVVVGVADELAVREDVGLSLGASGREPCLSSAKKGETRSWVRREVRHRHEMRKSKGRRRTEVIVGELAK